MWSRFLFEIKFTSWKYILWAFLGYDNFHKNIIQRKSKKGEIEKEDNHRLNNFRNRFRK